MEKKTSKATIATLGVLFVAFIWGLDFVLIHNAIAILEPHSFNLIRFGSAALILLGITLAELPMTKTRALPLTRESWPFF